MGVGKKLIQERAEVGGWGSLAGGPQKLRKWRPESLCRQVMLDGESLKEAVGPLHYSSQSRLQAPAPQVGRRAEG